MTYRHQLKTPQGITSADLPTGKVVCIGRNYAAHAKELNNPVPDAPLLFMKPATALVPLAPGFTVPSDQGSCHIETEIAFLIGSELKQAAPEACREVIAGVGIGFDLTLRDLQSALKEKGHPWEMAKAFDGSCPLTPFVTLPAGADLTQLQLQLWRNESLQQDGHSGDMLTPVLELLSYISRYFTLNPGDVVLSGTPAGVGPISSGDQLKVVLKDLLEVETQVL